METMEERPETAMKKEERTRKPKGDEPSLGTGYRMWKSQEVKSHPVLAGNRLQGGSISTRESHGEGNVKEKEVMERVYDRERLWNAWKQIKTNAGAAGVDKVTVAMFQQQEETYMSLAEEKLRIGHYRFKPARRVLIQKADTTKKRPLGIPVVMDRVVSQSASRVLEGIVDKTFTRSNFGYRMGKNQHQAVHHMKEIINQGYPWCVSIDLKDFFNQIPHGLIFKLIRRRIADERFVTLIARALKAGVVIDGEFTKTDKGCPQGSPLSPMLSNIVLNELDQELERRGHKYVRWADDVLIFVKSERAAKRVMEGITRYVEGELGLPVNEEKSQILPSHKAAFSGFHVRGGKIDISYAARKRFRNKIRSLTKRSNGKSMCQVVEDINMFLGGWIGYFQLQESKRPLKDLDMFIRNRLRSMQLSKWKKPTKFQRMMIRLGRPVKEAKKTWVQMGRWQSVNRREVLFTLNNMWFRRLGLIFLYDYTNHNLEFKFSY